MRACSDHRKRPQFGGCANREVIAELDAWQRQAVPLLFRGADLTGFGYHNRNAVRALLIAAGTSWAEQEHIRDGLPSPVTPTDHT